MLLSLFKALLTISFHSFLFYSVNTFNLNFMVTQSHHGVVIFFFLCLLLVSGPVEADPEYRLIVAANNLTVEIDNELSELASSLW